MNDEEMTDLIGLYVDNELPESLKQLIETRMESDPVLAAEVASLRDTVSALQSVPRAHPDNWFVERSLNGLLRENEKARQIPLRLA